ncbi:hypothetical protein H2201_007361 [Coniosporium apollinis]|uniref:RalA-binding protein 1 n=1 Tax=Coniosporium apollinis TaxID=61459 RepID=A0ABQ9NJ77_9PEZI|nr:hypothetical protein H2201_007361 [Coniosporium apollinis]
MPTTSTLPTPTTSNTLLFLLLFIPAFFPGLFIGLLKLPFRALTSPPTTSLQPLPACCPPPPPSMSWFQKTLSLPPKSRGSYLVTSDIEKQLPELKNYKTGLLNLFLQHTSAALSLNENWDSEVREDMTDALERIVPYDKAGKLYRHAAEGEDDMPAHIKSALIGASVTIPITDGRLATGTWQGIWYLEFRTARHSRKVVATIQGEKM